METLEAINQRYSCRRYDRSKLPEAAKIEILLHSAQVAPVACNKRDHIHISLISDLELLEAWDHAAACYAGAIKSHGASTAREEYKKPTVNYSVCF